MTNRMFTTTVLALLATIATVAASGRGGWTSAQLDELRSMSLASSSHCLPIPPIASPTIREPRISAGGCSSTRG